MSSKYLRRCCSVPRFRTLQDEVWLLGAMWCEGRVRGRRLAWAEGCFDG
jgi:hypothetical protein